MALDVRAGVGADHRGLWRETTDASTAPCPVGGGSMLA